MTWYATIGVLQEQHPGNEWVMVHDAVNASDGHDAWFRTLTKAFQRAARANPRKRYPIYRTAAELQDYFDQTDEWNFWQIAVFELDDGIPIVYGDSFVDVDQIQDYIAPRGVLGGQYNPRRFAAAGQGGGGDSWVQKWEDVDIDAAHTTVTDEWIHDNPRNNWDGIDWKFEGVYGFVEEVSPGRHYRVYDGEKNLIDDVAIRPPARARIFGTFANPNMDRKATRRSIDADEGAGTARPTPGKGQGTTGLEGVALPEMAQAGPPRRFGSCRRCSVCVDYDVRQGCCTVCGGALRRLPNPTKLRRRLMR